MLQASSAPGRYRNDNNIRLRGEVMTADTADKVQHVMAQLHLLPAVALRDVLMIGHAESEMMTAFQNWLRISHGGSRMTYVELLRRLKLTAAELRQTNLLSALTLLADSTPGADQEQAILPLLQKWHRLLQRPERYQVSCAADTSLGNTHLTAYGAGINLPWPLLYYTTP